ncbi:MAG TPA: non-homologous end-joining DNA ligase [Jatrophihabitantaceae bacterium]|nr:non-homologous end-joining DNA ligase [Jatrophihabitantaceae bacterium]
MTAPATPMLATSGAVLPSGPGWTYEFKWDGVRALVNVAAGTVRIHSRLGNEVTIAYPELAGLGTGIDDALVDGEIVAFVDNRPSFGQLQLRMHVRSAKQAAGLVAEAPVSFIAFDLLRLYGVDLTARPLAERRTTLERLAADFPQWTVSPSFDDGPATETAAQTHGLEGVVAKRVTSRYRFGQRTNDWVKVKFTQGGEFVVVGWEADAADGSATLSSLLLGYYEDDELRFAGKVGSGLSGRESAQLKRQLTTRPRPALAGGAPPPSPGRTVTWVEPEVVVQVTYSHWADDGRLRHPVFVGIRNDKDAREVVRDG